MTDKATHLVSYLNLDHPRLAAVKTASNPAEAFVAHLSAPPRPRFWLEYERKAELIDYLKTHYEAWRHFDAASADRVAGLAIEAARQSRALSEVPLLGRAWWATGNAAYGAAFQQFYAAVPTGQMFNWDSFNGTQAAIELNAFFMLLDCPGFTMEGRIAFLDHLFAIADDAWDTHVARWSGLMLGPEGHNWWLHGVRGLPAVGLLFPECKRAGFLLKASWSVIEEHVRGHYKADGGARETTVGYQLGSMINLWEFYTLARRNGHPVSAGFAGELLRDTLFLLRLMTPCGGLPSFGDDGSYPPGSLTDLASIAAALSGDRECKWYAEYARARRPAVTGEATEAIPVSAFWHVGLEGAMAYAAISPKDPHLTSVLMGPTGYAALRTALAPDALHMGVAAADRGPIVTSHGHNDVFSLDVHAGGIRFIGEMGCAPYGVTPGRAYDEKTEAHSCLAVEGMEQAPILDEWRWEGHVIPCVRRWISEDTHDFVHGVHEGYYRYRRHETLHARKIFLVKAEPAYWVVLDRLESAVENAYKAYFHGCVPGRIEGAAIILGEAKGSCLAIVPPDGDALDLVQVRDAGLEAYIKEKRLDAQRYPCFAFGKRAASDCLVWVLMPLSSAQPMPRVRRLPVTLNGTAVEPADAVAVEIAAGGVTDVLCVSHKDYDAELAFGTQRGWGCLAFHRQGTGGGERLSITHTVANGVCGR